MDKEQQELIFKLSMYDQQVQQLQQQLQAVEQGIAELSSLNIELDEFKGCKEKEIFASIGRGIFIKSKIMSEDFIVDVGNKNLVKKSIPETKNLISNQVNKLEEIKKEIEKSIEQINKELMKLINHAQEYEHEHGPNCGHAHEKGKK